jgi:serine/threonine protein kinase
MSTLNAPEIDRDEVEFGDMVGEGAFSKVYKGKCRGKDVAIKILHKPITDRKTLKRFKHEVGIMSSFSHPNICLFMGACTIPGSFFIVQEFMPKGDVEGMLKKNLNLSLFTRMRWSLDAALGVAWLHQSNPVFIHRDLKTSNLLIDENDRVKVCDFGLSEVKPSGQMLQDTDSAKGTPLWMAPEVMLFQKFNEKCDVYSFGIILWELLTRDVPFKDHNSYEKFKKAVCINHERPVIPDNCEPSIKNLIESSWDRNTEIRPSFSEIVDSVKGILVDVAIKDPVARTFWKENFLGEEEVQYSDFEEALFKYLKLTDLDKIENEEEKKNFLFSLKCVKALFSRPSTKQTETETFRVHIENFGKQLLWFGSMDITEDNKPNKMIENIRSICGEKWFFGDITTQESVEELSGRPGGTFLVRFSESVAGYYTLSQVSEARKVLHQRIKHNPGGPYIFEGSSYQSLSELVDLKNYDKPCVSHYYKRIFEIEDEVSTYLNNDSI